MLYTDFLKFQSLLVGVFLKSTLKGKVQPRRRSYAAVCLVVIAIALAISPIMLPKAQGQSEVPGLNLEDIERFLLPKTSSEEIATDSVKLDGRSLFLIAVAVVNSKNGQQDTATSLKERIQGIEKSLNRIVESNFDPARLQVISKTDQESGLPVIYINNQYLMTVTTLDAEISGSSPATRAEELTQTIKDALLRAKQERQVEFLKQQGLVAGGITLAIILGSSSITYWQRRLKTRRQSILNQIPADPLISPFTADSPDPNPTTMAVVQEQMQVQQQLNLVAVQRRLLQVGQLAIWGGGTFVILGLFPYGRWLQPWILSTLEEPLKVLGIGLVTSVVIRISAVLVDRFFQALKDGEFLPPKASQRLALRVFTFSLVFKRTIAFVFIGMGILVSLSVIGVNVAPLLAGAGIVGLAVSFASQNLIKDVINGFLILLDDQYAVGDVIVVGNVGGLVENMNLRITQLRNDEGRLITIPNSQITIVQNLSKDWSRVDLKIYVAYNTDLHKAFNVIEQVGLEMRRERVWHQKILESPEVLGVDELNHTGIMIRVWIKTQPLEQWNVAREYRRRLKSILDQKGISIGVPQQLILLRNSLDLTNQSFDGDRGSKLQ